MDLWSRGEARLGKEGRFLPLKNNSEPDEFYNSPVVSVPITDGNLFLQSDCSLFTWIQIPWFLDGIQTRVPGSPGYHRVT